MAEQIKAASATSGSPATARGVVAKGRTIYAQTEEKVVARHTPEGAPVYRFVEKAYKPGQEVTLPESEIKMLRRLGYLVDPDAEAPESGVGPNFTKV